MKMNPNVFMRCRLLTGCQNYVALESCPPSKPRPSLYRHDKSVVLIVHPIE